MLKKEAQYKIKGISQDLATQLFSSDYAYEMRNIRVNATDENSLGGLTNEKGNKKLDFTSNSPQIYDEITGTLITGGIEGDIIGVGTFSDCAVIFTTTSEGDDYYESGQDNIYLFYKSKDENNQDIWSIKNIYSGNLGFDKDHLLQTLCVYENEDLQKVYWIDGKNTPRVINIAPDKSGDDSKYKKVEDQHKGFLPAIDYKGKVTIDKTVGGSMPAGVIQYVITYSDKGMQETNIWYASPLYYISNFTKGNKADETCNVAFNFTFETLDKTFNFLQIYAIVRTSLNATPSVYRIANISTGVGSFLDTGASWEAVSIQDVLYKQLYTFIPQTIASKDNTLFLGNYKLKQTKLNLKDTNLENYIRAIKDNTEFEYSSEEIKEGVTGQRDVSTFRTGEWYRVGLQFQDEFGAPSEVVYLKDMLVKSAGNVSTKKFCQKTIKSELPASNLPDQLSEFKRVRLVLADRSKVPHRSICQGLLCPTIYRPKDRLTNSPFAMSSWCMRGYSDADDYTLPTWHSDCSLRSHIHKDSGEVQNHTKDERAISISIEDPSKIFINEDSDIIFKGVTYNYTFIVKKTIVTNTYEILITRQEGTQTIFSQIFQGIEEGYLRNYFGEALHSVRSNMGLSESACNDLLTDLLGYWNDHPTGDTDLFYLSQVRYIASTEAIPSDIPANIYCDHNILTFHSPDIEVNKPLIDNNPAIKYRILGYTIINTTHFDNYLSGTSAPYDKSNGGELYDKGKSILGRYNAVLWRDDKDWAVYAWNRSLSLSNQVQIDGTVWYGAYEKKIFSNVHFCENSYIFSDGDTEAHWEDEGNEYGGYLPQNEFSTQHGVPAFPTMGTPRVFDSDEVTAIYLDKQAGSNNVNNRLVYYGNVNFAHSVGSYHATYSENSEPNYKEWEGSNSDLTDSCIIQYKSTPHVVMPLNFFERTGTTTDYISPTLPSPRRVSYDLVTQSEPEGRYIWETSNHYLSALHLHSGYTINHWPINGIGLIYIAELFQDITAEQMYGETDDEESLAKLTWNPISDWVNLKSREQMTGYGDTFIGRWECLKTYAYSDKAQQSYIDITSVILESDINLNSRYDNFKGTTSGVHVTKENFNLFNPVYSQRDNLFSYHTLRASDGVDSFSNQICWSDVKVNGAEVDTWAHINLGNNLDLEGVYGELRRMINFNNDLYCFQDGAIYKVNYNTRVMVNPSDNSPIELSNNNRVETPILLSNNYGASSLWNVKSSKNGVYFYDSKHKTIGLINPEGQVQEISSVKGMQSFIKRHGDISNITYDITCNDIYFNFDNLSLAFNEEMGEFTSLYEYYQSPFIFELQGHSFATKESYIYEQRAHPDYCNFYNTPSGFYVELLSNPDALIDKTFTNIEFSMVATDHNGNDIHSSFDSIKAEDSYQESTETSLPSIENNTERGKVINPGPLPMKRKFRYWRLNIPRAKGSIDRIRDFWAKFTLKKDSNGAKYKHRINNFNVQYVV